MLQVVKMNWFNYKPIPDDTGDTLLNLNPLITFSIKAPIYWWADCDWIKYKFNMPFSDFEFCLDAHTDPRIIDVMKEFADILETYEDIPRFLMQQLPLSTYVTATIELSYQEIIEVCENYVAGDYTVKGYGFPDEREWKDFCETLLDIKGVRDLVKEEI